MALDWEWSVVDYSGSLWLWTWVVLDWKWSVVDVGSTRLGVVSCGRE